MRDRLAPEGGWLLVENVMAILGVSKQRAGQLVSQGRLTAKRHGRRLLIEEASVRARMAAPKDRGGRPHWVDVLVAPDGWLRPSEAARLLGCSRARVYGLIRAGALRAREVAPRRLIVERASVEAYIATHERGGSSSRLRGQ